MKKQINYKFLDSHYRWGSNGSDCLWEGILPGGEKFYCWGWEADPRDDSNHYVVYYSLHRPQEAWDGDHPAGYEPGGEFDSFSEVLKHFGYRLEDFI